MNEHLLLYLIRYNSIFLAIGFYLTNSIITGNILVGVSLVAGFRSLYLERIESGKNS